MAITVAKDKIAIASILATDEYITEYLGFDPMEIYKVQATDELLEQGKNKHQIFIYNTYPEPTINPIIWGVVYEIAVSVPVNDSGDADLAMEQIIALLHGKEISNTVKLEMIEPPAILSSETSLYQVGVRFISYQSIYTKVKVKPN